MRQQESMDIEYHRDDYIVLIEQLNGSCRQFLRIFAYQFLTGFSTITAISNFIEDK